MWLLLDIATSLTFLNVILKGLEQDTSNGCNACDVCDGNVIMLNPNSFAYSIVFKVTWLLSSSRINKCKLLKDIPPRTYLLKKDRNSLNKKVIVHFYFFIAIQVPSLQSLM
jgi:hypothetical protein